LTAGGSAFAFCPREGGSEELSGVFGGPPRFASNSAMRAFNAFTCASNLSMRFPGGDLHHEPVDPRQQRRHHLGATTARRINLSLRHGERESARRTWLNPSDPSHNAAEG
jgi:hypothetical protein